MEKENLLEKIRAIDELIISIRDSKTDSIGILDGVVNIDEYLNSEKKIMWILKEVHSYDDDGGWNLREALNNLRTEYGIESGWGKTFTPIVYTTYGILNNKKWDEMPDIADNPEIVDTIKHIAFINVKKVAGGSSANNQELVEFHKTHKSILLSQIELYNPDIIICGNTFWIIREDILSTEFEEFNNYPVNIFKSKNKIIIDAYHPNSRVFGLSKEKYCDSIIDAIKNNPLN